MNYAKNQSFNRTILRALWAFPVLVKILDWPLHEISFSFALRIFFVFSYRCFLLFLRWARFFMSFSINLILLKSKVVRPVRSMWRRVISICAIWSMYEACYSVHIPPSTTTLKRFGCPLHSGPIHIDNRAMVGLQLTFFSPFTFLSFIFCRALLLSFESIFSSILVLILLIADYFILNHFFSIASLIFDSIQYFRIWHSLFWFIFILSSIVFLFFSLILSFKSILSLNLLLILLISNYFVLNHFFQLHLSYLIFF